MDRNSDGIISAEDLQKRLTSLGCKVSLPNAEALMQEVQDTFGQLYGGFGGHTPALQGRDHWAWAMKLHQPRAKAEDVVLPEWSTQGQSKHSTELSLESSSVFPERSWDNLGRANDNNPDLQLHPSTDHLRAIQTWTQGWKNKIICPDCVDCSTLREIQHPPVLTPRRILDASPQSAKSEVVSTVMLTESGLMTEKDWHAHLSITPESKGLAWIGLRDCFFKYAVDMVDDAPLQFFTIVEFLMADQRGKGTASLEDCMNLMMKRFGSPSDSMFTKLFGNSVDPQQQIKLPVYLDKIRQLIAMKQIVEPSRSRTATAQVDSRKETKGAAAQTGHQMLRVTQTPDH